MRFGGFLFRTGIPGEASRRNSVLCTGCQRGPHHQAEETGGNDPGKQQTGEFEQLIPAWVIESQCLQCTVESMAQMDSQRHQSNDIGRGRPVCQGKLDCDKFIRCSVAPVLAGSAKVNERILLEPHVGDMDDQKKCDDLAGDKYPAGTAAVGKGDRILFAFFPYT